MKRESPPTMSDDSGAALRDIARAIDLQQRGQLDEAEEVYANLVAANDSDPTVLVNAGILALARDDVDVALTRLARAVAVAPRNAIAHLQLANAFARAGRDREAVEVLDRALALRPDLTSARDAREAARGRLERKDGAG